VTLGQCTEVRDVTKFEVEFDDRRSNLERFHQIRNSTNVLKFERFVVECEFVEKSLLYDWFHMHRQPESADKPVLFFKFNLSHKLGLQLLY